MKSNRWLFILAALGLLAGASSAVYYSIQRKALPPVFKPAQNPYAEGIYASGILQSDQDSGTNTALYPEVSGTVRQILAREGQAVQQGQTLLLIDDSVQRSTAEQIRAQADAARTTLEALRAQPRPEALAVAQAQVDSAAATLKLNQDALDKLQHIYVRDPQLIAKDQLDNAVNTVKVSAANLAVARRQLDLTRAGAWKYDIAAQQQQYAALDKAYQSSLALLEKYTIKAPVSGTVLSVQTTVGSYVSPQGTFDTISGSNQPVLVMGGGAESVLAVRCYVDEILIQRLSLSASTPARLYVRGTEIQIPLQFVRVQPYISPKIQLSNERAERVDLRVLTVIFRFTRPAGVQLYPGQLVDVYIGRAA
jgi:HlyD family secretion protein